ncbi:unnamed protein product [Schistosoma curassoni]|uniref:MCM N-terminal domain-containing protein n=1 Tax=Schistosoma curassoni TaxID=6186 RepID=A0A183JM52_9TREM|nr:unnamed protein product [Schistosoma curassoni]
MRSKPDIKVRNTESYIYIYIYIYIGQFKKLVEYYHCEKNFEHEVLEYSRDFQIYHHDPSTVLNLVHDENYFENELANVA